MAVKMSYVLAMYRRGVLNWKSRRFLPFDRSPKNCVQAMVLSRFYWPRGGCRILMKHGIRKFIVSTVAIVCKLFNEQRVAKKPNKFKNSAWLLK